MSQSGNFGLLGTSDIGSQHKQIALLVSSMISKMSNAAPVTVVAVTNAGGAAPIGHVNIVPLVQQVDGSGNVIDHGVIYNVPYMRIQGGANAVIIDPQVGDIGIAAFCDRDISAVKAAKKAAPPGSGRQYNMSDAVYLGSIIAPAPQQYVRFSEEGIEVVSPISVRIQAPTATIDANTTINGNLAVNDGSITNDGVPVDKTHFHDKVQPGSGNSGTPVAP